LPAITGTLAIVYIPATERKASNSRITRKSRDISTATESPAKAWTHAKAGIQGKPATAKTLATL